jgi:hypothetical protein
MPCNRWTLEMAATDTPATTVDTADPGDEVQRRFRYQINYCALKALQLLVDDASIRAIYCEQIEDLLVEFHDGCFCGMQIKTRELDQSPIKANDQVVIGALARFCVRDAQFPGQFAYFVLVTNFVFYRGTGGDDVRNVLECARDIPKLNELSSRHALRRNIEGIAEKSGLPTEQVVVTLSKVRLEERKTGIDQPDLEVVQALGQIGGYSAQPHTGLMVAARLLKARVWEASSLAIGAMVLEQHQASVDFNGHISKLRVARKRIDAAELVALLASISHSEMRAELLTIANFLARKDIPPGLGRMEFKMAAGAISYFDIAQAKDDVATLESAFLHWKERNGLEEANRRLAHFQYLALRDARVAQQLSQRPDVPYGQAMLQMVRARLGETTAKEVASLFGCRTEHLLGAAGLLTEECKLWWGTPVSIGGGDGNPS